MSESLKDKTVKGVGWSAIDNVSQYAVSFVVSIVLARLLSPDDYGLLGLITIVTAICTTLINGGFSTALIRKKDITDDDYNTAFIVNLGMSVLLYVVIFFCSPFIADFFNREELISLTRVTSFGLIIGALSLVQSARLTKRIDFKSQTKITLIASIVSGIVGIVMALLDFGVWALVTQTMANQGLRTVFLWVVNKWIPQLRFSKESFHNLFGFGWKMMLSGVLDTVWKELYQVVVGKFYTPATLGQYTRSKQFSQLFSSNLTSVIQRVTYPVLSNIQDDRERMVFAYRRIIKVTMFITSISMFAIGAVSEPLLYCLIGPKWHEAATYLPLICLTGSTYPLHAINLNMLQVQGRSDLFLVLEVIKKIIGIAPLAVCIFYGIMPMLWCSVITTIIAYFLNSQWSGKLIGYSSWQQICDFAPSYGAAALIAFSVWFLKYLPITPWFVLPLQIIVGTAVFFLITHKMEEYKEVKSMVMPALKKIKGKVQRSFLISG
jgi:O-antigen/teichoic acid export membrane protein